jgi:pimeloyl-ACP methyl ester carboxylesterase
VRALGLFDTQALADDEAGRLKREDTAKAVLAEGIGVLADSMPAKLLAPGASPKLREQVEAMIRTTSPQGAAAALRGMAQRPDSKEILSRYAGPALVVVGAEDALTPPEKARQMSELLPNATLVTISGAGHLANLEAPDAFNTALETFLASR